MCSTPVGKTFSSDLAERNVPLQEQRGRKIGKKAGASGKTSPEKETNN